MTGKKFILILVFIVFTGLMACHTVNRVSSSFRTQALRVDGNLSDWETEMNYHKPSKLYYSISNDRENLYVALNVKDAMVQRKIMMFGMTLWMDTTGGKGQLKGLRYPVPAEKRREVPGETESNEDLPKRAIQARPDDNRKVIVKAHTDRKVLLGFNDKEKETVSIAEDMGIDVRIQAGKMTGLTYEAKIPFDKLYSSKGLPDKKLSLGIITGHLELSDGLPRMRPSGGMNPGGGMYPGGGRRGGGTPGGRFDHMEELQKSTELWLKGIRFDTENQ